MRTLILSLFLFISVNAQNVWYVDRDATGNNSGTSWGNAAKTLDKIWTKINGSMVGLDWNLVESGDTIYVSGGTDSTVYPSQFIRASLLNSPPLPWYPGDSMRTYSQQVVIAPAWHAGHNGKVYIINKDKTKMALNISGFTNLKFTGFTVKNEVGEVSEQGIVAVVSYAENIIVDNCHFISDGSGGVLSFLDANECTLNNSILEILTNNIENNDVLGLSFGSLMQRGGHTITNNTLINRSQKPTSNAHVDMIQMGGEWTYGNDQLLTTTIANNFIWAFSETAAGYSNIIYAHGINKQRFLIYNNLIVADVPAPVAIIALSDNEPNTTERAQIYNNTFILTDGSPIYLRPIDSLIFKNNIVLSNGDLETTMLTIGYNATMFANCYKDVDYNYYYLKTPGSYFASASTVGGSGHTWAQWQAAGFDTHSDMGYISLADVRDSVITAYFTTTGRNAGVNLSSLFTTDIRGVSRPSVGPWDLGALQDTVGQSNNVNVKSKIYLQGSFINNSMSTNLNQSGFLPNSQPYNTPPWNYNGNESFNSGPNSTMVDWVLVELRSAANPTQVVARRAAVLKNNGLLLNTDGSEGVVFSNMNPGSYYVAVYHRNHLAIMSAAPVPLSSNSALYDFTTAMNKAYGQDPMFQLAADKFGMYASDGNSDGIVNNVDRDNVWLIQNGNMGYLGGDFNMNSGVTVHDVNQLWNFNIGKMTQVP